MKEKRRKEIDELFREERERRRLVIEEADKLIAELKEKRKRPLCIIF